MTNRIFTTSAVAALVAGIGLASGPAWAVDIFTIGTQDSEPADDEAYPADRSEFGTGPTGGDDSGPYLYDAGDAINGIPGDGDAAFPIGIWGPDEQAGGAEPGDFNPIIVSYTTSCFLLPGTDATLLVDLAGLKNDADVQNVGAAPDLELTWSVEVGAAGATSITENIDTGTAVFAPDDFDPDVANPREFPVTQGQLGDDVTFAVSDGYFISFDYIALTGDCVTDFAKISGKAGGRRGRGDRSFSGAVGTDTDENLVGTIEINYKSEKSVCTFTPTDITYGTDLDGLPSDGDTDAEVTADYECTGGDFDGFEGEATLFLDPGDTSTNDGGGPAPKNKDRGNVAVTGADDSDLDFASEPLSTGNVLVDDDTSS